MGCKHGLQALLHPVLFRWSPTTAKPSTQIKSEDNFLTKGLTKWTRALVHITLQLNNRDCETKKILLPICSDPSCDEVWPSRLLRGAARFGNFGLGHSRLSVRG